jgi:hypothetical protein
MQWFMALAVRMSKDENTNTGSKFLSANTLRGCSCFNLNAAYGGALRQLLTGVHYINTDMHHRSFIAAVHRLLRTIFLLKKNRGGTLRLCGLMQSSDAQQVGQIKQRVAEEMEAAANETSGVALQSYSEWAYQC